MHLLSDGLLFLAPALLLALPLLAGRYLGETRVVALGGRIARPRRRATPAVLPRGTRAPRVLIARGGRLIAVALAERGPPASVLS